MSNLDENFLSPLPNPDVIKNEFEDTVLNTVISSLNSVTTSLNSVSINLTALTQRVKEHYERSQTDILKLSTSIKVVNEKCDAISDIHEKSIVVHERIDKLDDVVSIVSANSDKIEVATQAIPSVKNLEQNIELLDKQVTTNIRFSKKQAAEMQKQSSFVTQKLDDVVKSVTFTSDKTAALSQVIPSFIEMKAMSQQLASLTKQVAEIDEKVEKQSTDAKISHTRVTDDNIIMKSSLLALKNEVINQIQKDQNKVLVYSTYESDTNPDRSKSGSDLCDESVQGARGSLQQTPQPTIEHPYPSDPILQNTSNRDKFPMRNDGHLREENISAIFDHKNKAHIQPAYFQNKIKNHSDRQIADEIRREALKSSRYLCRNHHQLEKYDKSKYSKGYFIRSRILTIAQHNQLTEIEHVIPWIPLCFPNCPELIENEIAHIDRLFIFKDDALAIFLTTLARRLNRPYGQGVNPDHLVRKSSESVADHVDRLYVEYDTVIDSEEELSSTKSETQLTKDIYNQLRYRDDLNVRQTVLLCSHKFKPIDSRIKLELLAIDVDNCMIDGQGHSRTISSLNQHSNDNYIY